MKILYLHPRSWTGEYPMLVKLRAMGHTVCALEEDRKQSGACRLSADFQQADDGIATFWYHPGRGLERLLTWPFDRYYRKAFDGRNLVHRIWVIAAAVRRFRPDVVIASDGFSYAVPAAMARRHGLVNVPLIAGFIGGDILDAQQADYGRRRTPATDRLIKAVVRYADWLRPVSPKLAAVLRDDGADPSRIRVVPSHLVADTRVTDLVFAERTLHAVRLRQHYGVDPAAPLIVTLSGNQKGKGLHIMAAAWPSVVERFPAARWLLCGPDDSWLHEAVWPLIDAAGLRGSVIFAGRLHGRNVFEHLAAADVHANPTLCEGLNMVTVESAAVGTPTICTDGAGISTWLERFQAGVVVPAGMAEPLAAAIIKCLGDTLVLGKMSSAGRTMIAEFALDQVARQLVGLFETAVAGPSLGRPD